MNDQGGQVGHLHRMPDERLEIIRAMIANASPDQLARFRLTLSEEVFFRARSKRALEAAVKDTSKFKAYYALPIAKPFRNVLIVSASTAVAAIAMAAAAYFNAAPETDTMPLFTATAAVVVAAVGWAVTNGLSHRNTIRQNTNSMVFARFSQAPFADAVHRFHRKFGLEEAPAVTADVLNALRATGNEEDWRAASSVGYLLNYFELIANGVLSGDLNHKIIRANFRGVICFYHDKCWPYIRQCNQSNAKIFENLIKLRTHYREP